ncbi:MAG: NAD(P)/FAD-dependent oxidoreductase [Deltaproteobacteria bacterium]|nr:NAD(P)/FAD-dependent oxidoreductase [Deltaproteobacteria bacterium]
MAIYDAIIIGSGTSGITAAIHLSLRRWKTLVIDKDPAKGYVAGMGHVDELLMWPGQTHGKTVIDSWHQRLKEAGGENVGAEAISLTVTSPFVVSGTAGERYESKAVIIATGAALRSHAIEGEQKLFGRGVYHDVDMHGPFVRDHNVIVVGKSQHAVEAALKLTKYTIRISLIVPSVKLDAPETMIKALEAKGITPQYSTSIKRINGDDRVTSVAVLSAGVEKEIPTDGVFTLLHDYHLTTAFWKSHVECTDSGAIKVDDTLSTSIKGIFACGDVLCGKPQFPLISAAQGQLVGIQVDKFLNAVS